MATPTVVSRIQNRRGTQVQFEALYPAGYTGIGPFPEGTNPADYPNILLPGEIALCTDTGRVYIGNLNGEFIEFGAGGGSGSGSFGPLVIELAPNPGVFTPIVELDIDPTPFVSLIYSVTDTINDDWNTPGETISKNGELTITSTRTTSTLTDSSTELNSTAFNISFVAEYDSLTEKVVIKYTHDFPTSLQFSTSSIVWQQFA